MNGVPNETWLFLMKDVCAKCGTDEGHTDRGTHYLCPALDNTSSGKVTMAEHLKRFESKKHRRGIV